MRVQSLGQENLLEEETAACSWKNPIDRGAWWATVHGVSKSQTRLNTHTHGIFVDICSQIKGTPYYS